MKSHLRTLLVVGCVTLMSGGMAATARAAERGAAAEFGLGLGSVVCNFLYGPAKVIYGIAGSVVGGLAYAITGGRQDVARAIVQPAVRGDYVVTPDHLTGAQPLQFTGQDPLTTSYPR